MRRTDRNRPGQQSIFEHRIAAAQPQQSGVIADLVANPGIDVRKMPDNRLDEIVEAFALAQVLLHPTMRVDLCSGSRGHVASPAVTVTPAPVGSDPLSADPKAWNMTVWHEQQHDPITWEMFLEIDEDIRRDLEIVDGFVVPREQRGRDHQKVGTRLSLAFEQAAMNATDPFPLEILWEQLEVAPRV
ncbi:hypothetical protein [Actinomadura rudentiformis]|uniref:Uncharacterized protein n=1 Tax=Actinomadura rudentiformis TaxID=359158 RepID=A0A6H9YGW8_9ACTN|nr:hypothetical protein [Actinomadura rudentiformis]KAB2339781.1 hypothetical protein F8566_46780 [Actinomadura rudentiformis]